MQSILQYTNVSKTYGSTRAIADLDLELPETGIVGLIGRNGSGKTTFLNLASGLILPTKGKVRTYGELSNKLSDATVAKLGVVPHRPQFIESQSIRRYLEIIGNFYSTWDETRVKQLLEHFELDPKARIRSLSEGQKQKLSIVVATAHHPKLLLLDEPMSNLDPVSRATTIKMLWDMLIDDGVLIVLSSHILHDIEKIADWVCALDNGRLKLNESLDDLSSRHQRWQIKDDAVHLPDIQRFPGFINHRKEGTLHIIDTADANHSDWKTLRAECNGHLETTNLSLDDVFQYISHDSKNL